MEDKFQCPKPRIISRSNQSITIEVPAGEFYQYNDLVERTEMPTVYNTPLSQFPIFYHTPSSQSTINQLQEEKYRRMSETHYLPFHEQLSQLAHLGQNQPNDKYEVGYPSLINSHSQAQPTFLSEIPKNNFFSRQPQFDRVHEDVRDYHPPKRQTMDRPREHPLIRVDCEKYYPEKEWENLPSLNTSPYYNEFNSTYQMSQPTLGYDSGNMRDNQRMVIPNNNYSISLFNPPPLHKARNNLHDSYQEESYSNLSQRGEYFNKEKSYFITQPKNNVNYDPTPEHLFQSRECAYIEKYVFAQELQQEFVILDKTIQETSKNLFLNSYLQEEKSNFMEPFSQKGDSTRNIINLMWEAMIDLLFFDEKNEELTEIEIFELLNIHSHRMVNLAPKCTQQTELRKDRICFGDYCKVLADMKVKKNHPQKGRTNSLKRKK